MLCKTKQLWEEPVSYTHLDVYKRQIQYRDMLTQAHNKAHVVFDEQNRDVEFIPHKTDGLHQFCLLYTSRCV